MIYKLISIKNDLISIKNSLISINNTLISKIYKINLNTIITINNH